MANGDVVAVFSSGVLSKMRRRSIAAFPKEAYGIYLGRRQGKVLLIEQMIIPKARAKTDQVMVEASEFALAETEAEEHGLKLLGSFHSHPFYERELYDGASLREAASPGKTDVDHSWGDIMSVVTVVQRRDKTFTTRTEHYGKMHRVKRAYAKLH